MSFSTVIKPLFFVLLVGQLCSCSFSSDKAPARLDSYPSEFAEADTSADEALEDRQNPIDVEIAQAFIDSYKQLQLKVLLRPKLDFSAKEVELMVRGLKDGTIVKEESVLAANAVSSDTLKQGETYAFRFSLDASELSEYQVECRWGKDVHGRDPVAAAEDFESSQGSRLGSAAANVASPEVPERLQVEEATPQESITEVVESLRAEPEAIETPAITSHQSASAVRVIEVEKIPVSCPNAPCNVQLVIQAELKNQASEQALNGVDIAVGLVWRNDGAPLPELVVGGALLDGEELVELRGLDLGPAETRKLRLKIGSPVPVIPGGQFEPTVRLLSAM